ncbi:entericidin A/B family lipoprotein [Oleisolibacter albus]|uniref:entericidin A/B family lipoprotein n=1 Tax=Oleisolibacter albus TaxID=2171757 RepID=UPI000DF27D2E|nr:entericidin A/B family lipoprotein [Oleisolibacter albus]
MAARFSLSKISAAALLLTLLGLTACNTVEGAGQDLQAGGEAIEKSADRNK